jgi:hypothetical protein
MRGRSEGMWWGIVLEAPDPRALAVFYTRLLGWPVVEYEPDHAIVKPPQEGVFVVFQHAPDFVPPVWPGTPEQQRMTMHLDVQVDELDAAAADAIELGATVAEHQPQDNVRVLFDPAGHPFCLVVDLG